MSRPYGPPGSEEPTQGDYPQPGHGQQTYGHPQQSYRQQEPYGWPTPHVQQQDYPQYGQQGYAPRGYHTYGQPGDHQPGDPGQPGYRRPRQKAALTWIVSALGGVVVLAVILVLGFVTPGLFTTTVFDQNAVQQGVQRILSDEYGQHAQSVTCPADQEVRTGSSFTCQATIDGVRRDVTITVKTDAGKYEVARPS